MLLLFWDFRSAELSSSRYEKLKGALFNSSASLLKSDPELWYRKKQF